MTVPFISIWTNEDTAEAGPTVDEKAVRVDVDKLAPMSHGGPSGAVLHFVTDDASVGLWTVAVTLDRQGVRDLIDSLGGLS